MFCYVLTGSVMRCMICVVADVRVLCCCCVCLVLQCLLLMCCLCCVAAFLSCALC